MANSVNSRFFCRHFCLLLTFFCHVLPTEAEFTYTAISSKTLLSDMPYKIATTVQTAECPVTFDFKIVSLDNQVLASQSEEVAQGESKAILLQVGELDEEVYNLTLKATSCEISVENSTQLVPDLKPLTIFIETDKPIYKGGDEVKFRVLVLNRFFQPFEEDRQIDIKFFDPLNNLVKSNEALQIPGGKGLFSRSFLLAKEPNLGEWKIQVKTNFEVKEHFFTVGEYVLPKFKVDLDLSAPFLTFKDSHLTVSTSAIYTFGKSVAGECAVSVQQEKICRYCADIESTIATKNVPLSEGIASSNFDLVNDLQIDISSIHQANVRVNVSCTDRISGHAQNATKVIELFEHPHKIEGISKLAAKPGLPFEVLLRISTQDNMPIQDASENAVIVELEGIEIHKGPIPASGIVSFNAPLVEATQRFFGYEVQVKYKELDTKVLFPSRRRSQEPQDYMQLKLVSTDGNVPRENGRVGVTVEATTDFQLLQIITSSRGLVLMTTHVPLPEATRKADIFFNLPPHSSPQIEALVYFINQYNEVVLDTITIEVEPDTTQTPVLSIQTVDGASTFEPGADVTLQFSGSPDSHLALRAVDQSVLLLKADSTLDSEKLLEESKKVQNHPPSWRTLGAPEETLKAANMAIMSNIEKKQRPVSIESHSNLDASSQDCIVDADGNWKCPPGAIPPPTYTGIPITDNVAFSETPQNDPQVNIRERSFFPETWIWEEHDTEAGQLNISKTVPDTITSWILSGYQISPELGIRMASPEQLKLTVFRPFFIHLNLPYSIVQGEAFALQIIVHNYMDSPVKARVTLENDAGFFKFLENEGTTTSMFKDVDVDGNSVTSVTFPISPLKFGTMELKVIATSPTAGDSVKRLLIVKPPGIKHTHSSSVLLNVLNEESTQGSIKPIFPSPRVEDADSLIVSTLGDVLGSSINNLDKLIKLPSGCGEQNMLNFVPNVVVLDYLIAVRQLKLQVKRRALGFLETGYQQQLKFLRDDGSFAIWGKSSETGSTWLTAFVAKSFISARKYITIDTAIVDKSLTYLINTQQSDGSFREEGFLYDKSLQGGAGSKQGLAAYILLTFVEARAQNVYLNGQSIDNIINKGIDYLVREEQSGRLKEVYPLVLLSYLLQLTNHQRKEPVFDKLDQMGIFEKILNQKHWEPSSKAGDTSVKPADVEVTSYALLTYLIRDGPVAKKITDTLPIANWLLKQQTAQGGFKSTQDTVVGITALAKFSQLLSEGIGDDDAVKVTANWGTKGRSDSGVWESYIGRGNRTWAQEYILSTAVKEVKFNANGKGTALAQLTWSYYVQANNQSNAFKLDTQVEVRQGQSTLYLKVSTSYLLPGKSNMAIVEISAPSGYEFDHLELLGLEKSTKAIKRFELQNRNTKVNLYFDSLDSNQVQFTLPVFKVFPVANHSPSYLTVYDYYDVTKKSETEYNIPQDLLCSLCKEDGTCKIPSCK